MYIPPKWAFLVGGVLLTVISAFVTGYVVSRRDTQRKKVEARVTDTERQITYRLERFSSSRSNSDFAQVLRSLIQRTCVPQQFLHIQLTAIVARVVHSISDLYSAATGSSASQQEVDTWTNLAGKAETGDSTAVEQLYAIQEQFESQFQTQNNSLVKERDELRGTKVAIELETEKTKYIGLSFQIFGLVIVLLKDLFYG